MISPKWAKVVSPAPRPTEGQGKPLEGGGLVPSFCGIFLTACFVSQWVTGTHGRTASRAFLSGEGAFLVPPHRPFSHALCFVPAPGFFFKARCAMLERWLLLLRMEHRIPRAGLRIPWNSPRNICNDPFSGLRPSFIFV